MTIFLLCPPVHPTKREVHLLYEDAVVNGVLAELRALLLSQNESRTFTAQTLIPGASYPVLDPAEAEAEQEEEAAEEEESAAAGDGASAAREEAGKAKTAAAEEGPDGESPAATGRGGASRRRRGSLRGSSRRGAVEAVSSFPTASAAVDDDATTSEEEEADAEETMPAVGPASVLVNKTQNARSSRRDGRGTASGASGGASASGGRRGATLTDADVDAIKARRKRAQKAKREDHKMVRSDFASQTLERFLLPTGGASGGDSQSQTSSADRASTTSTGLPQPVGRRVGAERAEGGGAALVVVGDSRGAAAGRRGAGKRASSGSGDNYAELAAASVAEPPPKRRRKRAAPCGLASVQSMLEEVSFLLFTVTLHSNHANNLTRSPYHL